jgi:RNA polymerase sigma factor (sigma-70 family)
MNSAAIDQQKRERFFSSVTQHLNRLFEFVRRQVAYFESVGDLIPGELAAEEVVDAVLLRAYRDFVREPVERPPMEDWLIQLATKQLQAEIRRRKSERRTTVHLEEDAPETPPLEEVSTLGEEILEFYQPDEDFKLEDFFPEADVSTPEDWAAAKEELLNCVNASLAGMPREWRRALRLHHAGGLTLAELAEALQKSEPEIERVLEYARRHLRQSLRDAGCTFMVKDSGNRKSAEPEHSLRRGAAERATKT